MSAAGGGDGHDSGDADGVPAKGSGSLKAPVATTLFVTFGFLGFGTGWSSQDSIFQQVNKYTAEYDDLTFAGELVLLSNLAAAITLALTFSGLYLAPGGVELRTVRFFEATITSVLAASCGVQITMATSWNISKRVVEACALVAGVIGDLQAFIVYPFFNAFYRTELIAFMNLGETVASLFSGALALIQSPTTGVEYFSVGAYFGVIFVGTVFAALAWMSLSYRRGYRRHDDGDDGASPTDSATETEDEGGEGEGTGVGTSSYGATDDPLDSIERRSSLDGLPYDSAVLLAGDFGGVGHGIAITDAEADRTAVGSPASRGGPRASVIRKASYFDLTRTGEGGTRPRCGRAERLFRNLGVVLSRPDSHLRTLFPLAVLNSLMTWTVVNCVIPFCAAATVDSCDPENEDAREFIRLCTSTSSIFRVLGPLFVRSDGAAWGHPTFVTFVGVVGLVLNFVFCAPAVMGPVAGASDSPWMTEYGRWWLWFAYVASTPIEPFMQLHLLIATQRENRGSSKRIIDAGFGFAASMVILSFVVAAGMNYYAAGGTAVCPGSETSTRGFEAAVGASWIAPGILRYRT